MQPSAKFLDKYGLSQDVVAAAMGSPKSLDIDLVLGLRAKSRTTFSLDDGNLVDAIKESKIYEISGILGVERQSQDGGFLYAFPIVSTAGRFLSHVMGLVD